MELPFFNLDIEPTNRCNASCYFCPRDQTPHQGLMTPETFDQAFARILEFQPVAEAQFGKYLKVNMCGLGEPLLNKHTPDFVAKIRDAGFECSLTTNGALLDERRGRALIDAGLQGVEINVGEIDDGYEEIYGLPFEKTRDNVVRFNEMAAGTDCNVRVVLVDHRRDAEHLTRVADFWRSHGIDQFLPFEVMNRGGALFVDHMQYDQYAERAEAEQILRDRTVTSDPVCAVPFMFLFIGYDGQHYLCCSDWKKEAPLGTVFDRSFVDVVRDKLEHVLARTPVCVGCNLDPINRVTEELRAVQSGDVTPEAADRLIAAVASDVDLARRLAAGLDPSTAAMRAPDLPVVPVAGRKLIPVAGT